MQYYQTKEKGLDIVMGMFSVIKDGPENCKVVVDFSVEILRNRMSLLMKKQIRELKPEGIMLSWVTKLGTFVIYREYDYSENNPYESKFRKIFHCVELDKRKHGGEVETKRFFLKEQPNPECKDYEECCCNSRKKAMYEIKIGDHKEMRCIDCKKFNALIKRIGKKLEKEKEAKKKK